MTNAEIDEQVLSAITSGAAVKAGHIQIHIGLGPNEHRVIDRSLRRLRKRGLIKYDPAGWQRASSSFAGV